MSASFTLGNMVMGIDREDNTTVVTLSRDLTILRTESANISDAQHRQLLNAMTLKTVMNGGRAF